MACASTLVVSAMFIGSGNAFEWNADRIIRSVNLGTARGICIGTVKECLAKLENHEEGDSKKTEMMVTFELNSAQLTQNARLTLQQIAVALNDPRLLRTKVVVKGYTDASGPAAYNLKLSQRRARSVADFLLKNGLLEERVNTIGIGENKPRVADEFDPVNRRVEIHISIQ